MIRFWHKASDRFESNYIFLIPWVFPNIHKLLSIWDLCFTSLDIEEFGIIGHWKPQPLFEVEVV